MSLVRPRSKFITAPVVPSVRLGMFSGTPATSRIALSVDAPQNGSTRADVAHVLVTVALHAAMRTADAPLRLTMEMGCEQIPSGISDLVEVRKAILARLNEMSSD